jgi:Ca2+-binding RTX toxin-like protein
LTYALAIRDGDNVSFFVAQRLNYFLVIFKASGNAMTIYLLTTGNDTITGTAEADTFDEVTSGGAGGVDILKGNSGDDEFFLYYGSGTIDGGAGTDTVILYDSLGLRTYKDVEILDVQSYMYIGEVYGTLEQLLSFESIVDSTHDTARFYFSLTGMGGDLDFSTRIEIGDSVHVESRHLKSGATIVGTSGQDYIAGSNFDDILNGAAGDDHLETSKGKDTVLGGAGNDKISITGEHVQGTIDGGSGLDTVFTTAFFIDDLDISNVETLLIDGRESVSATVKSLSSFTQIQGYWESWLGFYLAGDGGQIDFSTRVLDRSIVVDDYGVTSGYNVVATSKNDSLTGSGFDDTFQGGAGSDTIDGRGGVDTASYTRSSSGVTINLAANIYSGGDAKGDKLANVENITGSDFADYLTGDLNANRLSGGKGNDTLVGGAGADRLIGGDGTDTVSYADAGGPIVASLANSSINTGDAAGDTYFTVENLYGSGHNDTLNGGTDTNMIVGDAGDDMVKGYSGNDKLAGNDGNDLLNGGVGADYISGGLGSDTASYTQATGAVKVNLADPSLNTGEAKGDTFNSIENLEGSAFNDTCDGNSGANTLSGLDGSDLLRGGGGNDTLKGGAGGDTLGGGDGNDLLAGGMGADYLSGGLGSDTASYVGASAGIAVNLAAPASNAGEAAGDTFNSVENLEGSGFGDRLTGNAAANVIKGLNGTDQINGGGGSDTLAGGTGKDVFVFSAALGASNVDTITDFSPIDDTIQLENSIFAALTNTGTPSSSYFRANATGTAQDANDFIVYETGTGKLFYDADGSGAGVAIQFAVLAGHPAITDADFVVI